MLLKGRISIWDFVRTIKSDLLTITVFSIIVGLIATGHYFNGLEIPLALIAIIGTAISLLLAFRTAQSYDRWWEARIVWGAIVNDSRTLIRQVQQFLPAAEATEVRNFAERQIIWNYALSESLRKLPFSERVQQYTTEQEIRDSNVPNGLLSRHSAQLRRLSEEGKLTEFRQVQLDQTLVRLCDAMGKCERIKNTVFPASYGTLIHFLIYVFALLLPFSLDDDYAMIKALLTAGIPMIFIVIERTAILMQDPFENRPLDTPMTTISQTIEVNLRQQIGEEVRPPAPPSGDAYYIL
ncbi:bestrophin family protein [Niabella beijingensis]|uniref:bestrophin family protein n=1 Tax=Niabella beijingensis TaxID=2872700 RepID=UPI001CBFD9BE|nr:bestrophin family ion channel [Niabella beijingensis]MBZ4191420.1 hypothetical protein [Niabella beijingensis]